MLHWMHVRRSFALLCDHCSHFFMTILVYGQFAHIFYILFTWTQFTCYIILVLLLLALPWRSNVFCASVSSYRYICSKFITAPMIHDRGSDMIGGEREKEFCVLLTIFLLCSSFMIMFSCLYYICFVPMLCSLVLIVNVMHFFKYITLVPLLDFISLMQLPCVVVSVEC